MKKRLILDIQGTGLTHDEREQLSNSAIGGVIFFARNYRNRDQLLNLINSIKSVRPDILLTVDQEGGRVQRFQQDFMRLPALQQIGRYAQQQGWQEGEQCAWHMGWLMAAELIATGIDCSFAPVVDTDTNYCSVIADRAFSDDPQHVIHLTKSYIDGMNSAGMAATLKHFPGHGVVEADSHLQLPVSDLSLEQLAKSALKPFQQLSLNSQAVMVGHLLFPQIDAEVVGYSQYWLNDILRKQLNFDGLIFSDDLSMKGADQDGQLNMAKRAQKALDAGCDMILVCNNPKAATEVIHWLNSDECAESQTDSEESFKQRFERMRHQSTIENGNLEGRYKQCSEYSQALYYLEQLQN